jgi:hypothetical protein
MMIPWQNVTNNPTERYSDEAGNYWYTYKATILVDDPLKTALKMANIQDPESLSFGWKMDKMAKNVDLNFKVGTSTRLHCRSTDWSLVEDLTLNRGDNIEWVFLNLNQSIRVQAWIAIPPKSRNIWVFKNTRLNTPIGPDFGYTNEEYLYSTNEIGHKGEVNYEFEFDGKPDSNLTERSEIRHKWDESGLHTIRVRAEKDHEYCNWSDQRSIVIYNRVNFIKNDLKYKLDYIKLY